LRVCCLLAKFVISIIVVFWVGMGVIIIDAVERDIVIIIIVEAIVAVEVE